MEAVLCEYEYQMAQYRLAVLLEIHATFDRAEDGGESWREPGDLREAAAALAAFPPSNWFA